MPKKTKRQNDVVKVTEPFFIVSSLEYNEEKPVGQKKRYSCEDDAIGHCRDVILERGRQSHDPITLCVLQVVSTIHFAPAPIEIRKLK